MSFEGRVVVESIWYEEIDGVEGNSMVIIFIARGISALAAVAYVVHKFWDVDVVGVISGYSMVSGVDLLLTCIIGVSGIVSLMDLIIW